MSIYHHCRTYPTWTDDVSQGCMGPCSTIQSIKYGVEAREWMGNLSNENGGSGGNERQALLVVMIYFS